MPLISKDKTDLFIETVNKTVSDTMMKASMEHTSSTTIDTKYTAFASGTSQIKGVEINTVSKINFNGLSQSSINASLLEKIKTNVGTEIEKIVSPISLTWYSGTKTKIDQITKSIVEDKFNAQSLVKLNDNIQIKTEATTIALDSSLIEDVNIKIKADITGKFIQEFSVDLLKKISNETDVKFKLTETEAIVFSGLNAGFWLFFILLIVVIGGSIIYGYKNWSSIITCIKSSFSGK